MRIPSRFAPLLFGALLSSIMVALVSAFVLWQQQGLHPDFAAAWLRSMITTWPVAFVAVTLLAPPVRRLVVRLTTEPLNGGR